MHRSLCLVWKSDLGSWAVKMPFHMSVGKKCEPRVLNRDQFWILDLTNCWNENIPSWTTWELRGENCALPIFHSSLHLVVSQFPPFGISLLVGLENWSSWSLISVFVLLPTWTRQRLCCYVLINSMFWDNHKPMFSQLELHVNTHSCRFCFFLLPLLLLF